MILYDPDKPIVVCADAGPIGLGCSLAQAVDGIEKPVSFFSCTLTQTEQKYPHLHKEALALVFAVKKLHKYIYGKKFLLCSDSKVLKSIFDPRKSTEAIAISRLQR